jgi:hypothetical protein
MQLFHGDPVPHLCQNVFVVGGHLGAVCNTPMLQTAPLGRALPLPPVIAPQADERDVGDDLGAASCATPRPPVAVARLAHRIMSASMLAKHWIAWACVSVGLWAIGTALAIVAGGGRGPVVLALGFGGLAGGVVAGALWFGKRYLEANKIAREGQLVIGVATFRRSRDTLGGELSETFGALLGETCHSVVFSIGFIRHEVRVAFADAHDEGEPCSVLVQPGARHALAFDRHGRAHVGELLRIG